MKKRIVTLSLVVALAATAIIGGTMAYFTSEDEVTNTFTVGKVGITLDEADVDEYGNLEYKTDENGNPTEELKDRVQANSYKLIPGHEYTKDPTVTVLADSEESYIRMKVTVTNVGLLEAAFPNSVANDVFLLQDFVDWDSECWLLESADEYGNYEFRYKETVDTLNGENLKLDPLFTTITIPPTATNEDLAEISSEVVINIEAQAIQADGFDTAADAWASFPTTP